jgi:F-type H+-transporting ATPase subunit epsilon
MLIKLIYFFDCSYVNYSNIAAKVVRRVLKPELQANASKRDETHVKFTPWVKGKPSSKYQYFFFVLVINNLYLRAQ